MNKGNLYEYVMATLQEEECLVWDSLILCPHRLEEYEENVAGSWIYDMVSTLIGTYEE